MPKSTVLLANDDVEIPAAPDLDDAAHAQARLLQRLNRAYEEINRTAATLEPFTDLEARIALLYHVARGRDDMIPTKSELLFGNVATLEEIKRLFYVDYRKWYPAKFGRNDDGAPDDAETKRNRFEYIKAILSQANYILDEFEDDWLERQPWVKETDPARANELMEAAGRTRHRAAILQHTVADERHAALPLAGSGEAFYDIVRDTLGIDAASFGVVGIRDTEHPFDGLDDAANLANMRYIDAIIDAGTDDSDDEDNSSDDDEVIRAFVPRSGPMVDQEPWRKKTDRMRIWELADRYEHESYGLDEVDLEDGSDIPVLMKRLTRGQRIALVQHYFATSRHAVLPVLPPSDGKGELTPEMALARKRGLDLLDVVRVELGIDAASFGTIGIRSPDYPFADLDDDANRTNMHYVDAVIDAASFGTIGIRTPKNANMHYVDAADPSLEEALLALLVATIA